ncbi:GNAT family N-acetyltransferase [Paenibacillus oceani]|uniref:Bifunctional AAC/APH n=1 Tax=Paenibacillus oceani TaxID=2772510 RepID=A0A927GYZ8_9BACL|nr:GNAT family N-acetyltransferase [Paenibacillus oceani]MBD2862441.1 GNAT family N-acetyltransferase [Paenibacillus oceani]
MMLLTNMIKGLEHDAPAKLLIERWAHDEGTLTFWRASSNFVYHFERDGKRHWLRFIHETDKTVSRIQAELDFMLYLLDHGYPTVAPVRSTNGVWIETVLTEDGLYYGVVFEQAKGKHVPIASMSDAHLAGWGKTLASLHRLSKTYTSGTALPRSWEDALAFIASVLQRYPRETVLRHELERLRGELAELPSGTGHTGLIHYDFETDNLFYSDEESRYYAIDFDDAMIHWYMMDVTSAISDLLEGEGEEAERSIRSFLAGYRSVRELDESDVRLIPVFRRFEALYTFARLLRSVEGMDMSLSPDWALQLREKLMGYCDRIRDQFRPKVELKPVDADNWYDCTQLQVTEEQTDVFPVQTVYWLAESAYCGFTPLALYTGEQMVGLAVYAVDPDDGSYWIMAFMIDRLFQGRGLGRSGMEALVRYMKEKHNCDKIVLGHRPDNERAAGLYASFGFVEVDRSQLEVTRELIIPR